MRSLFASASLLAVLIAGGAQAAEAGAADAPTEVEAIVVTGEKTNRSIQDTTTSVAVVTSEKIEQENIQNFNDIVQRTPNMSETYGAAGFTIRGISNTNVSGGGSGGLATVYVDGAAIPDRGLSYGPLEMWDVGQVEILRGPQSTLQGRNALAGAVIIRSQDPTFEFSGKARLMYSDHGDTSAAVAVGGPIIADQLAFRLSAEKRDRSGFVYNQTRDTEEDFLDATTIRGKLLLTPSALPDLTVRAVWTHDERQSGYFYTYSRTDYPNYFDNRKATADYPNDSDSSTDIFTVEADHRLGELFTLSSITSWSRVENLSRYDGDNTAAPLSYGIQDEGDETLSQELRLNYDGDRLSGVVGVWYSKRERDYELTSLTNVPTPVPTLIGVLQAAPFGLDLATATFAADLYAGALPVIPVDFHGTSPEEITTVALFADGRYQLTDRLSILAGFRYDREENVLAVDQTAVFAGAYPDPALYGLYAPIIDGLNTVVGIFVSQASASAPATSREFEAFLPKLGVKYDFTDDISASFVVQRGYRSGGSTVNQARSAVVAYDPEYTWNYEVSLRTQWLDRSLTLNANAFYVDWTDQQVSVNLGLNSFDYQTENAGKSHLYGFEVELFHQPSADFGWYASIGHTRTEFDEFEVTVGSLTTVLTGSEFAFAPHWTAAAGADWRWDNGMVANINASYRGDQFSGTGASQAANWQLKARTLVNAKVGWENERWGVYAYGNNLFDAEYVMYEQRPENLAMLGAPRVVGIILETRW
ncbi:MAG: TonB-dependent receptor [Caulobacter sp.]|nr:TonB-dependent receptor [Caulobacter sp.]